MKNCRFCYSEIHQRAKICPQCHHQLSAMGSLRAFLITAFPILTAIISLGFAFVEKYEKGLVQSSLAQTETRLEVAEVQYAVAEEAVDSLSRMVPRARMSAVRDVDPSSSEVIKTPEQKVDEIESEIVNLDFDKPIDIHDIRKQLEERMKLKTGLQLFQENQ